MRAKPLAPERVFSAWHHMVHKTVHRSVRLIALMLGLMLASLSASAQTLTALSATRSANANLTTGGQIRSALGTYTLVVQGDGNLVIYPSNCFDSPGCAAFWNSGTAGPVGSHYLAMQSDGNLVMYRGTPSTPGAVPIWASGPTTAVGAFHAVVGDDGNLVVNRGSPSDNRGAFWSRFTGYFGLVNDAFASRINLGSASSGTSRSSTSGATTEEEGEPQPFATQNATVWWQWTAPSSGVVTFNTFGSDFNTGLTAWAGTTLFGLSGAVFNDNAASGGVQSQLSFNATAGTTYQIRVGGQSEQGSVNLNWYYSLPTQTISFAPLADKAVLSAPFTVSATASSGLPVSFSSSTPAVCSVSGSTVALLTTGVCTVAANQTGNASFAAAATVTQSFTVNSLQQSIISFEMLGPRWVLGTATTVSATASSGLPVSFSSRTLAVCSVSGNTVAFLTTGVCTVAASQAGNASYAAAATVPLSVPVTQPQTISFEPLAPQTVLSAPFTVSATASSGLPVSFSSTTPAVCSVSGNTVALLTTGVCTVAASQAGNASYEAAATVAQSFTVDLSPQTISFAPLSSRSASSAPFPVSATASSGLPVSFSSNTPAVCSVSGNTVALLATGVCTVAANQAGNASYAAAATVAQSFPVNLSPQTISFAPLAAMPVLSAPFTVSATASSGLPVSFSSITPAVCSVSGSTVSLLTTGVCTVAASQAGNASYAAAATVAQSFTVAAQVISFAPLAPKPVLSAPFTMSATASSGLPVSFSSSTPAVCSVSGNTVALLKSGVCTLVANQAGNASVAAAPTVAQSFTVASQLAAGDYHTCALTSAGAVQCWGYNVVGQLGDNSTTNRLTPVAVSGLSSGVVAIAAGGAHTCALTSAGAVQCWGSNGFGQLGDNSTTNRLTPVAVSGLSSGVVAIAAGGKHTCAITSAGAVQCWGYNYDGQLGDNTTTNRLTPVAVSGLSSGVVAIAAGASHTCALTSAGAVQCWGYNVVGQLGDNTTTNRLTPVAVSGLSSGVVAIAAGGAHTCALTSAGAVQCWGSNGSGQLGDNSITNRLTPVTVSGLSSGVVAIAAGGSHTCALTSVGAVQCWGYNYDGQLGDDSDTDRLTPVAVSGLSSGVVTISAGFHHTCALTSAGAVQCWGWNAAGQLGDNSTTGRLTPVAVSGPGGAGSLNLAVQASTTSLTVSSPSILYGDLVTLTATVSGSAPTGTVQFKDGGSNLGPPVPLVNGTAVLNAEPLGQGSRSITATYSGDGANAGSVSGNVQLAVGKSRTSTSGLSVSPTSPVAGTVVTISASVNGFVGPATGQVQFFDGSTSLGTATLMDGVATLQTNALGAGAHNLVARYLGDANNASSDSAVLAVTVAPNGPGGEPGGEPGGGGADGDGDVPIPDWALALLTAGLLARAMRKQPLQAK